MAVVSYILSTLTLGVISNTAHNAIQAGWAKVTNRTWEELLYDSFRQAFEDSRPHLERYAHDGEVNFDESAFHKILRQNLALNVNDLSLSEAGRIEITRALAVEMRRADVLIIGGNSLSTDDHEQIARNLIKQANANFRNAVLSNEQMFRQAVLAELQGNQTVAREVQELLKNSFDVAIDLLGSIKEDTEDILSKVTEMYEDFIGQGGVNRFPVYAGIPSNLNKIVGQEDFVQRLVQRLTSNENIALEGLGGIGKTTLAIALAKDSNIQSHFNDGILWAGLGLNSDVGRTLTTWLDALGQNIPETTDTTQFATRIRDAIGNRRLLFVIDDVWDAQTAKLLCCGGPNCRYLLTTRDQSVARAFAGASQVKSVPLLSDEVAHAWLRELAPETCEADPGTAQLLAKAAGGLPLVIKLLGGYLGDPERSMFADLQTEALEDMKDPQNLLRLAHQRLENLNSEETLRETILLSLETLPESTIKAFHALGSFAPKPESFSREAAKTVAETDTKTLATLVTRNLIEKLDGGRLSLHQVVASVAEEDRSARLRHLEYYVYALEKNRENWRNIEHLYGQVKWTWKAIGELDNTSVLMRLVYICTEYQKYRGLLQDALFLIDKALGAETHRTTVGYLRSNRGYIYYRLGRPSPALADLDVAISSLRNASASVELVNALGTRGMIYAGANKHTEALLDYKQALTVARLTKDATAIGKTLQKIGALYVKLNQPDLAIQYLYPAMFLLHVSNAQDSIGTTLRNIGFCFREWGEVEKSIDYLQLALETGEKIGHELGRITALDGLVKAYLDWSYRTQSPALRENRLEIARPFYNALYNAVSKTQSMKDRSEAFRTLGWFNQVTGDLTTALEMFHRSYQAAETISNMALMEKARDAIELTKTLQNSRTNLHPFH